MQHETLKLTIDLVPKTCWYTNLRKLMRDSQWDKLRKKVYADAGHLCQICGTGGRLNCHEIWQYDDERRVQKLTGFQALCNMCNFVKHFGMAGMLASQGKLDLAAVIQHFLKVNGVSRELFEAHETEVIRIWRARSERQWQTDLAEWISLVPQNSV